MSHSPSAHQVRNWEKKVRQDREEARLAAMKKAADRGLPFITAWNEQARTGKRVDFFPTIGIALATGHYRLTYYCPACTVARDLDLRTVADKHHPRAPISVLIPKLSCNWCCPNPPLAVLTGLEAPAAAPAPGAIVNAAKRVR